MLSHRLYYTLKPLIPRSLQILFRRGVAVRKQKSFKHVWPIDERAGRVPQEWSGWPDGKKFALVLLHDVDTEKGHEKCLQLMQLDEKMGFRSSFNFVPERYHVSSEAHRILVQKGFEVGVHGLKHDGKLFSSKKQFQTQAIRINHYLKEWKSVGFVSPSMHRNLEWVHDLNIEYDASTFDTDPFEPQPDGVGTIFPFWVAATRNPQNSTLNTELKDLRLNTQHLTLNTGYVELPYTLPQDHTLFVIMRERDITLWKKKLDWIVEKGGMALLITHPDYMNCKAGRWKIEEYPMKFYEKFLDYVKSRYEGQYWHVLPKEMARFWKQKMVIPTSP